MDNSRRDMLATLAALAACAALPAWAHDGASHTAAAGSGAARAPSRVPLGTAAAVDAEGRLWVAQLEEAAPAASGRPARFNIVLAWSADDGQKWTTVGPALRVPEPVEANGEGRPKLAFGPGGQIYLTFTSPLDKPHTGHIRFVRSIDGGRTFSAAVTVQRDLAGTGHRFDSIMVDREGRVFIAWIDKRGGDAARAGKRAYRGAAVYCAVSTDNGASFGADVKIADHCCECCRIALSLNAQGQVVAMWRHIFEPNVRDHAMAVLSPTGKAGAIARVSFDDWRIDACPHHGPALAYDGAGARHQVWFSGAAERGGLFYVAVSPDGLSGEPVRLGGRRAEHGEVLAAGRTIAVAWKEFDGKTSIVTARISHDGGTTWEQRSVAASGGASDHPHLVGGAGAIRLVWRTQDDGLIVRGVAS
jgi:hypothetical protein